MLNRCRSLPNPQRTISAVATFATVATAASWLRSELQPFRNRRGMRRDRTPPWEELPHERIGQNFSFAVENWMLLAAIFMAAYGCFWLLMAAYGCLWLLGCFVDSTKVLHPYQCVNVD